MNSPDHSYFFSKADIVKSFNRSVKSYDNCAVIQNIVGERLSERLDLVVIEPEIIIDIGSGTGNFVRELQQRYKKKKVIGIDIADKMSAFANKKRNWLSKERYICADAEALPFADNSVDLVFSNLMLQWLPNPDQFFEDVQRVLKPGGLLMFSSFGPDTLKEMRQSWDQVDDNIHVNRFIDMHDIGDSLSNSGFAGIVMDTETITMTYESLNDLHQDLKGLGETNLNAGRAHSLTGKTLWNKYLQAYEQLRSSNGDYPATWEIAYGHAWATDKMPARKMDMGVSAQPFNVQQHKK